MTSLSDIGDRLIEARVAQGLTQRELAEKLGVHQQQIARWERESYGCVSLARLSRVADALAVGWDDEAAVQPLMAAEAGGEYGSTTATRPVRDLGEVIARIRAHAPELQERYGVTRIAVFGSFARGEQRPDSDVDLIVEVEYPSLENVFGVERALGDLMGRPTETGSMEAINPRVRTSMKEDLVDVWQA